MASNDRKIEPANTETLQLTNPSSLETIGGGRDKIRQASLDSVHVDTIRFEAALELLPNSFHGAGYEDLELFFEQCEFALGCINEKWKYRFLLAIKYRLRGKAKRAVTNAAIKSWGDFKKCLNEALAQPVMAVDRLYLDLYLCKKKRNEDVLTYSRRITKLQNDILAYELNGKPVDAANALEDTIRAQVVQVFIEGLGDVKMAIRATNPKTLEQAVKAALYEEGRYSVYEPGANHNVRDEQDAYVENFNFNHFFCTESRYKIADSMGVCSCQLFIRTVLEMIACANRLNEDDMIAYNAYCRQCGSPDHSSESCVPLVTYSVFNNLSRSTVKRGPSPRMGHDICFPVSLNGDSGRPLQHAVAYHFVRLPTYCAEAAANPGDLYLRMPNEITPMYAANRDCSDSQQGRQPSLPRCIVDRHPSRTSVHQIYLPISADGRYPSQSAGYHFVRVVTNGPVPVSFLKHLYLRIPNNVMLMNGNREGTPI